MSAYATKVRVECDADHCGNFFEMEFSGRVDNGAAPNILKESGRRGWTRCYSTYFYCPDHADQYNAWMDSV